MIFLNLQKIFHHVHVVAILNRFKAVCLDDWRISDECNGIAIDFKLGFTKKI